jgi:hypothetical protein
MDSRRRALPTVGAVGALALAFSLALAFALVPALGGPGLPLSAQQPTATPIPPPCPMTWTENAAPTDVEVGQDVHVEINIGGECERVSQGMDVFFVIDRTVTMFSRDLVPPGSKPLIDLTKDAIQYFVNSMDATKSHAGVISYAADYQVNRNLGSDMEALVETIDRIRMSQETDVRGLVGAFRKATELIDNDGNPANKKYIFIITAGPDQPQELLSFPTVTQAARNAGVNVVFLMWSTRTTDSAYSHYVGAASECTWSECVNWSDYGPRYAWRVAPKGARAGVPEIGTIMTKLADHFLFGVTLAEIDVEDAFDPEVMEFIPVTPPQFAPGPPYTNVMWAYTGLGPTGIKIVYDATMLQEGTHPVALMSVLRLQDSTGRKYGPYDLPIPVVNVHARTSPTVPPTAPTVPTAETPTVSATTPPTATTPPPSATPTVVPTTPAVPVRAPVYFPACLRRAVW